MATSPHALLYTAEVTKQLWAHSICNSWLKTVTLCALYISCFTDFLRLLFVVWHRWKNVLLYHNIFSYVLSIIICLLPLTLGLSVQQISLIEIEVTEMKVNLFSKFYKKINLKYLWLKKLLFLRILNAFAEEAATEDAIYYMGEALRRGVIDLDVFLKQVRALSRKQFMLRALMHKCRQKAGLVGWNSNLCFMLLIIRRINKHYAQFLYKYLIIDIKYVLCII